MIKNPFRKDGIFSAYFKQILIGGFVFLFINLFIDDYNED